MTESTVLARAMLTMIPLVGTVPPGAADHLLRVAIGSEEFGDVLVSRLSRTTIRHCEIP